MKYLYAVLIVLVSSWATHAVDVSFIWDPSPTPDVRGYRLYASQPETNGTVNGFVVDTGTACAVTLTQLTPGPWAFHATAYTAVTNADNSIVPIESDPSDNLRFAIPAPPASGPKVTIQRATSLSVTSWQDIKYFKLQ